MLEIGTGSGYETAILAEMAASVFSIERIDKLASRAKRLLEERGYKNIYIKIDDGTLGWKDEAPFDKIIVTASSPKVPAPLVEQLSNNGKMVIPVGSRFTQTLMLLMKTKEEEVSERPICGCCFVPLIGEYGWADK